MMIRFGIITMFTPKNWGFITEDCGDRWFLHSSNCCPGYVPKLGDAVQFVLSPPYALGKQDQATHVRPLETEKKADVAGSSL